MRQGFPGGELLDPGQRQVGAQRCREVLGFPPGGSDGEDHGRCAVVPGARAAVVRFSEPVHHFRQQRRPHSLRRTDLQVLAALGRTPRGVCPQAGVGLVLGEGGAQTVQAHCGGISFRAGNARTRSWQSTPGR